MPKKISIKTIRIVLLLKAGLWLSTCVNRTPQLVVQFIDTPARSPSAQPFLFTDPGGNIYLTWIQQNDTLAHLRMAQWKDSTWSAPVDVISGNNWFVNWADYPVAVSNGKGSFLAHFLEKRDTGKFSYDIKIVASADGRKWTTPVLLHNDGQPAEHGFVYMVPYGEHVLITWLDGRNTANAQMNDGDHHGHRSAMTLRAAVVNYRGEKQQEWELDGRVCDCCQTTAAITTKGPVVIYRDRSEDEVRDIALVRLLNGQWSPPRILYSDNWKIAGCPVNGPRCDAIGNTLVIAWFAVVQDQPEVKVIFSADGGETFGPVIRVSTGHTIGRVDVVLLDEKTAVVSWIEDAAILIRMISADGKMGKSIKLASTSEARGSGFPQLTRTNEGAMMAWTDAVSQVIKAARIIFQ
jgi:hypothetical protein